MHKSELKIHPTFINRDIKEYELRVGTIGTHRSIGSLNQILKLTQRPTTKSQLHSSTLWKLQRDTKCLGPWPTIHCMHTPYELLSVI